MRNIPAIHSDPKNLEIAVGYAREIEKAGFKVDIIAETVKGGLGDDVLDIRVLLKGRLAANYRSWKDAAKELKVLAKYARYL